MKFHLVTAALVMNVVHAAGHKNLRRRTLSNALSAAFEEDIVDVIDRVSQECTSSSRARIFLARRRFYSNTFEHVKFTNLH